MSTLALIFPDFQPGTLQFLTGSILYYEAAGDDIKVAIAVNIGAFHSRMNTVSPLKYPFLPFPIGLLFKPHKGWHSIARIIVGIELR